jgi:hypothetical protein
MEYSSSAIPPAEVPRAATPLFRHAIDTYASEANKVVAVWICFADADLGYRPHVKSSTVEKILQHQLLSERRFFGELAARTPHCPSSHAAHGLPEAAGPSRSGGVRTDGRRDVAWRRSHDVGRRGGAVTRRTTTR